MCQILFMSETKMNTSQKLFWIDFSILARSKFKVYKGISMPQFDFFISG